MRWYSLSVSVSAGAMVTLSPVCTPIASRFSMEQMMMQLSARSRTTSISNSFQPSTLSSISTSVVIEASRPAATICVEFLAVVGDAAAGAAEREGRADDAGQADDASAPPSASSMVCAMALRGLSMPILAMASRNFWRSSALSIDLGLGADQLAAVFLQDAGLGQLQRRCSARSARPWSAAARRGVPWR